jgi:pimeloyl-[acyl-carrier protein] methyl ester esterase
VSVAVLLPGLDGTGALLGHFAESLGRTLPVEIVRYPADLAASYAELEEIARAALPADEPYLLVGESFSGPIAISLAAKAPPGLRGLVLCATFARSPVPYLRPFAPLLPIAPTHLPVAVLRYLLLGRWATPAIDRALDAALAEISPEVLRKRVAEVLRVDVSARLRAVRVPVMYLQAAQDRMIPASAAEHLRRIVPSIDVVKIDGPHFLLQAAGEPCVEKILDFARRIGLSAGA